MRVAVMGSSGSGKSTFARRLGAAAGVPHIELDAINWLPGWVELSRTDPASFLSQVQARTAGEAWVTDGNYRVAIRPILSRATHLVWLDYSRAVIMPRVIRRSFGRAIGGQELWEGTGNRELFSRWLDKGHPIRWAWETYHDRRKRYLALFDNPDLAGVERIRLTHPRQAQPLLERLVAEDVR